jgi:hypothetical protein
MALSLVSSPKQRKITTLYQIGLYESQAYFLGRGINLANVHRASRGAISVDQGTVPGDSICIGYSGRTDYAELGESASRKAEGVEGTSSFFIFSVRD